MRFCKPFLGTVLIFASSFPALAQEETAAPPPPPESASPAPNEEPPPSAAETPTETPPPLPEPTDLGNHIVRQVTQENLSGKWLSECEESNIVGESARRILTFTNNTFEDMVTLFLDEKCEQPAVLVMQTGTFNLGEMQRGARDEFERVGIDLNYSRGTVKPLSNDAERRMNEDEFCGLRNWRLNQQVDLGEGKRENCRMRQYPSTIFDIVSMDRNRIYFGATGFFGRDEGFFGGKTEKGDRPRDLNRNKAYARE